MAEYNKSMPVRVDETLEVEEKSQPIGTGSVNVKFSQNVVGLEVANNSLTATIYLKIDGGVATMATGIPIYPRGYYAADKKIDVNVGISLISDTNGTDVRIIGHYKLEPEE